MKNYIQKLILVFLTIFFFAGCTINTTVKGKVTSGEGQTIAGANVMLSYDDKAFEVTTNQKGNYTLNVDLPITQKTKFTVSQNGYITSENTTLISYSYLNKIFTYDVVLLSDKPEVITEYGSISGSIKDISGNILTDASIIIGSQTIKSDAEGKYTITNIAIGDNIPVTVEKDGYAQNANVINVKKDENSKLDFILVEYDVVTTFDSTIDKSIDVKNANVSFTANSFVDSNGNDYSGNITIEATFNHPSSYAGQVSFPGRYEGTRTDGSSTLLISYGFFNIELKDDLGNKLNLKDGALATLTYPSIKGLNHNYESIPLWYYDTEKGDWIEEGLATYDINTQIYTGTVSHFTPWNLDYPVQPNATIKGRIVDINGNPLSGRAVKAYGPSLGFYRVGWPNSNGEFEINLTAGSDFKIQAQHQLYFTTVEQTALAVNEVRTLSEDIVIDYDESLQRTINIKANFLIKDNEGNYYDTSDLRSTIIVNNQYKYGTGSNITQVGYEIPINEARGISIKFTQGEYTYVSTISANSIPAGYIGETFDIGTIILQKELFQLIYY